MNKKTIVIGASENPERYSYLAVERLKAHHHEVIAIGNTVGKIGETSIITDKPTLEAVDTVTLYINPSRQPDYYNYILSLHPKRIIFNPGTENDEFYQLAGQNNIEALEACTLVLLATGQF